MIRIDRDATLCVGGTHGWYTRTDENDDRARRRRESTRSETRVNGAAVRRDRSVTKFTSFRKLGFVASVQDR